MDGAMLEELVWLVENSESVNGLTHVGGQPAPMSWSKVLELYCPLLREALGYTPATTHSDGADDA